ncbi:hypothetical protein GXB84_07240 [Stenotrophomonas acidaminiphila]|uniref:hypothetical protein n=1 Tax=Stenotrophomonas TaxID=40323 RepID=UPI0013529417|nr:MULTISPECIES: hypothetical protein [Stenotrophomonas]MCH1908110.1 hypothetical protein [Stenotrophomonas sp. Y6]MTI73030.1 hypothetical protein [Stenotrophomonas sp.]NCT87119.1 hypothetical protein [Stenotrophomonas acidaminiphila]WPU54744.1 hypothetical protein SQW19_10250 [Stenotrophomonas acidaminiphila]
MRHSRSAVRALSLALLAIATTVTATGCFKRGARGDYALAPEMRPLEVPPDLTLPNTAGASQVPALASAARPAQPAAAQPAQGGFTASGSRDEVFGKVGDALATVEGVTIASRAQLLGSYDVAYEGSNFLVRVVGVDAGAYVSAVDPRGLPATDPAAIKLLGALKAKLAP